MRLFARLLEVRLVVHAHCDLPCGVYDPAHLLAKIDEIDKIFRETKS